MIGTPLLRGPLQETLAKKEQKKETKTDLLDSDIEDNSDSDEEDEKEKQAAGPTGAKITARTVVPDHLPAFPSKHSYKQTPVRFLSFSVEIPTLCIPSIFPFVSLN